MMESAKDAGDDLGHFLAYSSDVYLYSSNGSVLFGRGLHLVTVLWRPHLHGSVHCRYHVQLDEAFIVVS
jgi:hypothetical protein